MDNIKIRPNLKKLKIESYVRDSWQILQEYGHEIEDVIDCSLGVNPFGYSPHITESIDSLNWEGLSSYPKPSYKDLKKSIIYYWSEITEARNTRLYLGSGSIDILATLTRIFIEKGSKVLGYCPQFNEFENLVKIKGGKYDYMLLNEYENFKFSTSEFLERINKTYDVIYIDNPNNPTGQTINLIDIERILDKAKKFNIPVIIDEAYGDFMDKTNSAIALVDEYPNVIVVRSFSKGFGLANIRLGYVFINNQLTKYYDMVNIPPFVFPDILSDLPACALDDKKFLDISRSKIRENKERIIKAFSKSYIIPETNLDVPIFTLGSNLNINLYEELVKIGVLTVAGNDFTGIEDRFVRLRVPIEVDRLIKRLNEI